MVSLINEGFSGPSPREQAGDDLARDRDLAATLGVETFAPRLRGRAPAVAPSPCPRFQIDELVASLHEQGRGGLLTPRQSARVVLAQLVGERTESLSPEAIANVSMCSRA